MDDERTKELDSQLNSETEEDDSEQPQEQEGEILEDEEDAEENQEEDIEEESGGGEKDEKEKKEEPAKSDKQDRWHGKSSEEVIKSFEELESQANGQKNKKDEDESERKPDQKKKSAEGSLDVPSDEELAKMTPKDFAQWMIQTVSKMVEKTYDARGKVKDAVRGEIKEVQKDHPLIKTNQEYRNLVLAMIDTAAKKGEVLLLKEACVKVDALIGKAKGDGGEVSNEDKARLKKAKAQVERGAGAPTSSGEEKGAEQKRLESIFGTDRSKSPFGGLGV